jgi:thiamine-phosphate pyrophosphorylase
LTARLPARVLALTPGTLGPGDAAGLLDSVRLAAGAGLRGVLVREPGLEDGALLRLALGVREVLAEFEGTWLGVHDRAHVAALARADGVHLGFRSLPARRLANLGPLSEGFSAHAGDDPLAWEGADYLFFGPVRSTPSKQGRVEPVGFGGLAAACERASAPVWGIGGLEPQDVGPCLAAGAAGVCVLRGILAAVDPAQAAECYLAGSLEGAR